MSDIDKLHNHAEHVRWLMKSITDQSALERFEALANDLDRRAAEIERQDAEASLARMKQVTNNLSR
jgi:hypothetical protein